MAVITREFVVIPEIPEGWEEGDFINRLQDAVDIMEGGLGWNDDGDFIQPWTIVRSPRHGEARGTYEVLRDQTLQVLGGTVPKPDGLRDLLERAFNKVCGC